MVGLMNNSLIYVDNGVASMENTDILRSSELSLQLTAEFVMNWHDGLHHPIATLLHPPQILANVCPAYPQMTVSRQYVLQVPQSDRRFRVAKRNIDELPGAPMDLGEPRHSCTVVNQWVPSIMSMCEYSMEQTR